MKSPNLLKSKYLNMASQGPHQGEQPENPQPPAKEDLEVTLTKPVETGAVSIKEGNKQLGQIRETTGERLKAASEVQPAKKQLSPEQQKQLLGVLEQRFIFNRKLHENVQWSDVEKSLKAHPEKLWSLWKLEVTGGAPDVIYEESGEFIFGDCSAESPSGRRNVVFDKEAQEWFEKHNPNLKCNGNATDMVAEYGAEFMTENQFNALQEKLRVDRHTRSWLKTPDDIRKSGDALVGFHDGNYVRVHEMDVTSCNRGRGFRCVLRVPKA